jgi:hypothetical protein
MRNLLPRLSAVFFRIGFALALTLPSLALANRFTTDGPYFGTVTNTFHDSGFSFAFSTVPVSSASG